jgi:CRP-like cAMP-binding protein
VTGYAILDRRGRLLATHDAIEDATYAAREVHGHVVGWVVRARDGVTMSHHPLTGRRRVAPWPPRPGKPAPLSVPARPHCPIWAALRHPSTAADIAAVVPGVDRAEVSRTLLRWLDDGLVTWDRAVWSRAPGATPPRGEAG